MKRFILCLLVIGMMFNTIAYASNEEIDTNQLIWDYLIERIKNPIGVAAIMGNMQGESAMETFRYEHDFSVDHKDSQKHMDKMNKLLSETTDETLNKNALKFAYDGLYGNFTGFGLCGWTYWGTKEALFKYAYETDRALDDYTMQCDFLLLALENKPKLLTLLKEGKDLGNVTGAFRSTYERSEYNEISIMYRALSAKKFYEKYTKTPYEHKLMCQYYIYGTYDEYWVKDWE